MKPVFRTFIAIAAMLLWGMATFAQAPDVTATWKVSGKATADGSQVVSFKGFIADGWHIYTIDHEDNPLSVEWESIEGCVLDGGINQISTPEDYEGIPVFFGEATIEQKVKLTETKATLKGVICWSACNDRFCSAPEEQEFSIELEGTPLVDVDLNAAGHSTTIDNPERTPRESGLLGLIIEAILWGFAMLLTPCVFPMVPMTISFFMKQSSSPAEGRLKAFLYGLFIILLYTVPISVIIGLTWLIGGNAVTADIFNWLATHWLPNIIFFAVFMAFAASFFGAFEIELPSSLANKSDSKAGAKGIGGIFFMALTLVLVSFSCTGPIVGTVLIKSTQGEFWTPMVTILAFSTAFALPFTILAMFPSLLKKMKSGSWLNSVKVVLGFVEIALGFKFLSVADQTYHWGLLDREVYLAIWIVTFSLLGLYLLGKIRFKNDSPVEHLSVLRLGLAIAVFSFVVYMIPGMWGAPLKALSGYLPPIETQDFVVLSSTDETVVKAPEQQDQAARKYNLKLPLNLSGYFSIEEGLAASKAQDKPVFVDITGHGCVNCREMEQRVWSDSRIQEILRNEYVIVALYTDDKTPLKEEDWLTTDSGKVLKELGRANSYIVRTRFGVNAQPNYVILDGDGNQLMPVRGYDLSVEGFTSFLESGIRNYRENK